MIRQAIRRRPAAALCRRLAAAPAQVVLGDRADALVGGFDLGAWAQQLDLGLESSEDPTVRNVYLGTFSRVLPTTLAENQRLRDPSTLTRERYLRSLAKVPEHSHGCKWDPA